MALWTDLVKPATLTGVARAVIDSGDAGPQTLADIFPNQTVPDVAFAWNVNARSNDVAAYRAFDAEATIGAATGTEEKIAKLAPLSLKKRFGELDALRRMAPNSPETVQDAANRMAAEIAQGFVRSLVARRSEALVTGKLAINERGFVQSVDFGRRADHSVTAATGWDKGGDPIADIETWRNAFEKNTGVAPTKLKMSRAAFSALARNEKVRGYLGSVAPTVVSAGVVNETLAAYDLPAIEVISAQVDGKPAFDSNYIVLAAELAGLTPWGPTKNATDSRYGIAAQDMPGLVVAGYQEDDPSIEWIIGNATVLPVLTDPDLTLAAKVLGI